MRFGAISSIGSPPGAVKEFVARGDLVGVDSLPGRALCCLRARPPPHLQRGPTLHDDLRTTVLDSARRLLVQHGYAAVSMRKIADAAGCSVSSIYLYFANKDDLVHTLIDEGFQRWYGIVRSHAEVPLPPLPRLELHCREYVAWGLENPEFYEIMFMFHPDRMARYPKQLFRRATRSMDVLTELVAACVPGGFATADDARIAAHVVWAILHGVVTTILAERLDVRVDRARYIDLSINSAIAGVQRLTAPLPTA
jgi:AcrR family transcriptional regulator